MKRATQTIDSDCAFGARPGVREQLSTLSFKGSGDISMKIFLRTLSLFAMLLAALFVAGPRQARAQTENAALSGIIADTDGARIPGAMVQLYNVKTRDTRHVKSNGSGVFSFNAVPTGAYTITVTMTGFERLVTKNIELHPNDQVNLPELRLRVGAENISVTVEANTDIATTGERSSLITDKDIQKLSVVGRDVSELLRTQAGFSVLQSGLDNSTNSSAEVAGAYSGLSNYVGNGATANGASIISDGANVTDPTSGNGQIQTVNMDFVQEVKIETSNFGADTAKGPTVITAVGKSGGATYHGSARLFARAYPMNSEDWFQKFQHFSKIQDRYLYPGFNVGGPVLIPHTNFNHNRKLTFELGAEDYIQRNVYVYGSLPKSYLQGLVPTKAMLNGDFTQQALADFLGVSVPDLVGTGKYGAGCSPAGQLSQYLHICAQPNSSVASQSTNQQFVGGKLTNGINGIDPGARALLRAYYEPNCTNTDLSSCPGPGPTVNFYNTQTVNLENPDSYQIRARVDYAFNDANKVYFVYNGQYGTTTHIPEQIYYSPGTSPQTVLGGADTPGKTNAFNSSNLGSANYTHVFNSKMTNELFAAMSELDQTFSSGDAKQMSKSYWGYPYQGIFNNGSYDLPQIATYSSTGAEILPFAITPDYSFGPFIAKKYLPSGGDNFSYLWRNHTLKFGVYLERDTANQTDLSPSTNGQISDYYLSGVSACGVIPGCSENYLADFFLGYIGSFSQQNYNGRTDLYYWTASWFATDSYKVTRKLTLDYGVRFDHLGPWQDKHGLGMAVFYPNLYATDATTAQQGCSAGNCPSNPDGSPLLPGVRWHGGSKANNMSAGDTSVPVSGSPSRWAFVSPRFGIAYDALGNGTTIFRGGWGMYRAHDSWNDYTGPAETSQGIVVASKGGTGGQFAMNSLAPSTVSSTLTCNTNNQSGCPSILALDPNDSEQPLTITYSFSVSQRMPFDSVFDIAYVGNQSKDLLTDNPSQNAVQSEDLRDINAVPIGAFFKPDPNPTSPYFGQSYSPYYSPPGTSGSGQQQEVNDYRPYPAYTHLGVPRHITYANYNALQASWNRQKGRLNYGINYTFSKALGIRGAFNNGVAGDPTNLRANYGPLAFDRTHLIAASYSYDLGRRFNFDNRLVSGLVNNWMISGITNWQSGPNLQAVYRPDLSLQGVATSTYSGNTCTGAVAGPSQSLPACTIDNTHVLGTPDVMLQPILRPSALCPSGDPSTNLHKNQYVNGNCFGLAPMGVQGQENLGSMRAPAFFNSDLTLQKTIPFGESRNLQFRVAAFNFLNHPLPSFSSRFPQEANLRFYDPNYVGFAGVQLANANTPSGNCSDAGSQCFGYAGYKTGHRVMELSARYNF